MLHLKYKMVDSRNKFKHYLVLYVNIFFLLEKFCLGQRKCTVNHVSYAQCFHHFKMCPTKACKWLKHENPTTQG